MKYCTVLVIDEDSKKVRTAGFSMVSDDHIFGWNNDAYHFEGAIGIKHLEALQIIYDVGREEGRRQMEEQRERHAEN